MAKYEYYIDTQRIIPPVAGMYQFFAVLELYRKGEKKNERVYPDFEEVWGRTEEEARSKMEAKVKEWIASQD